jgi:hypothetical protein
LRGVSKDDRISSGRILRDAAKGPLLRMKAVCASLRVKLAQAFAQTRRLEIESGARALVFGFAFPEGRAAMPARPRGHLRSTSFTSLLIRCEINDVAAGRYDFFNHCCPRGVDQLYGRQVSPTRSAHRSNFTGEIVAGGILRAPKRGASFDLVARMERSEIRGAGMLKRLSRIALRSIRAAN